MHTQYIHLYLLWAYDCNGCVNGPGMTFFSVSPYILTLIVFMSHLLEHWKLIRKKEASSSIPAWFLVIVYSYVCDAFINKIFLKTENIYFVILNCVYMCVCAMYAVHVCAGPLMVRGITSHRAEIKGSCELLPLGAGD